jgi:hypothetical protein
MKIMLLGALVLAACEMPAQPVNEYPVGMTHVTSAEVPQTAPWLSPGLSLSGEIARRCTLRNDNLEAAPHFGDPSVLDPEDQDALLQVARCLTTGELSGRTILLVGGDQQRGESARGYLLKLGVCAEHVKQTLSSPDASVYGRVDMVVQ